MEAAQKSRVGVEKGGKRSLFPDLVNTAPALQKGSAEALHPRACGTRPYVDCSSGVTGEMKQRGANFGKGLLDVGSHTNSR